VRCVRRREPRSVATAIEYWDTRCAECARSPKGALQPLRPQEIAA
jgi:hypothetical protein